jgi:hypothetical protein
MYNLIKTFLIIASITLIGNTVFAQTLIEKTLQKARTKVIGDPSANTPRPIDWEHTNYSMSQYVGWIKENQAKVDAVPSEGITGPVHEKNKGGILFSSEKITRENMNLESTVYKNEFKLGEPIYAMAFLEKGLKKYLLHHIKINETYGYSTVLFFGGAETYYTDDAYYAAEKAGM